MLATETEAAILKRILGPDRGDMSADVAREFLKLGFDDADHARMEALSAKAREGTLSGTEQEELDGYINISHFIAFMHSRARLSLKNGGPSSSAA